MAIQTEDVILKMPVGRAEVFWCEMSRAREKYIVPGIKDQNLMQVGFGLGWVDALHNELTRYSTTEPPTGNESSKP